MEFFTASLKNQGRCSECRRVASHHISKLQNVLLNAGANWSTKTGSVWSGMFSPVNRKRTLALLILQPNFAVTAVQSFFQNWEGFSQM